MKLYEVPGHRASLLPEGKQWKLVWADEFDGEKLDESKWAYRTHMMGKKCRHWVKEEGISFDGDSHIVFSVIEKDGVYCTTQLQTGYNFMDAPGEDFDTDTTTGGKNPNAAVAYFKWPIGRIEEPKFMHRYGYYECRFKLAQKPGWWSAFWMQSPIQGATLNPRESGVEVDIMEAFYHNAFREIEGAGAGKNNVIQHVNHWNGCGSQHQSTVGGHQTILADTEDGFHTVGLEWTKDAYRYYVDGQLTWEVKEPISQREEFLLLTTEAIGYRNSTWNCWDTLKAAVGDQFIVDYVRVFDECE